MIREALEAYAKATQRTFTHDRTQTVGASEIGQCERKTFWIKHENDPVTRALRDEGFVEGWGARTRGSVFETGFWEPAMKAHYGTALKYAGDAQITLQDEFLSATPDALLVVGSGHNNTREAIVLECKSIDPRAHLPDAKPEHVFQAQVQMGLFRKLTPYKPERAIISYTNSSFWNEVTEFPITFDPEVFKVAQARAARIMQASNASEMRPEGWIAGGQECEYCPFVRACGKIRRGPTIADVTPVDDPQFVAEVADLARQYEYARQSVKLAEKQVRECQDAIKTRLNDKKARRIDGDGVSVVWSLIKGREQWDEVKLRAAAVAAGVEIDQFRSQADPSDRLTITIAGK